jgi:hypothetical protein
MPETGPVGTQVTPSHRAGARTPADTCDRSNVAGVRAMAVSGAETVETSDAINPLVQRLTGCDGLSGTTDPATPVAERTVTSNTSTDPEAGDSRHHLEHHTGLTSGSHTLLDTHAGAESPTVPAATEVEDLHPNTTHPHRNAGSESSGSIPGPDQTFTTTPTLPMVDVVAPCVPAITLRLAAIHGSVNENSSLLVNDHLQHTATATAAASGLRAGGGRVVQVAGSQFGMACDSVHGPGATLSASVLTAPFRTGVATNTATLITLGATGSCHFEPAVLDGLYRVTTGDGGLAVLAGAQPMSVTLTGLGAGNGGATGGLGAVPNGARSLRPPALVPTTTSRTPNVSPAGKPVSVTLIGWAPANTANPPSPVTTGYDPRTEIECVSPHADFYDKRPDPGDLITITGRDRGLGVTVASGEESLTPTAGNQTGFEAQAANDPARTSALTVNCGRASDTITVAVCQEPDNRFSVPTRMQTAPCTVRPVDR